MMNRQWEYEFLLKTSRAIFLYVRINYHKNFYTKYHIKSTDDGNISIKGNASVFGRFRKCHTKRNIQVEIFLPAHCIIASLTSFVLLKY